MSSTKHAERTDRTVSADDPDQQQTYPGPDAAEVWQRAAAELSSIRTKLVGLAETDEYPADAPALEGQMQTVGSSFAGTEHAKTYTGFARSLKRLGHEPAREALMKLVDELDMEIRRLNSLKPGQVTGPTP